MKKLLKGLGLFGLSALAIFLFVGIANANTGDDPDDEPDDNRCTYTNYYFFSEINHGDYAGFDGSDVVTATYFPGLEGNNIDFDNIRKGRICLSNASNPDGDGDNCGSDVWSLTEFYDQYKIVVTRGTNKPDGKGSNSIILTETASNGDVTRYFEHGNWYKKINGELVLQNGNVDVRNVATADLVRGSYLPDSTGVEIDFVNEPNQATVTRRTTQANWNSAGTFNDNNWCGTSGCKMAPALYKVVYTADCETPTPETPTYNATINYYYEGTTTKVPFKDTTKSNPYTGGPFSSPYTSDPVVSPEAKNTHCKPLEKNVTIEINGSDFTHDVFYRCTYGAEITYCIEKEDGTCIPATDVDKNAKNYENDQPLALGYSKDVKSPTIKNCKLKKEADKTVKVEIDKDVNKAKDFSYEVRYVCEEAPPVSPKTGIALIVTAWLVGLGALGYSAYYFINAKKEENL